MNWLEKLRDDAQRSPIQPRMPLLWNGQVIGTVAQGFLESVDVDFLRGQRITFSHKKTPGLGEAWSFTAPDASFGLNALAQLLREKGRSGPWRDEQIAVCTPQGQRVATVERGAVRVLGVATHAVHLIGLAPDGRMWVQQRSKRKPNHPNKWDTLMGGMVSATDDLQQALARETQEEAGLDVAQLLDVTHGGHVMFACPSNEVSGGVAYMRERIDWFTATVPEALQPENQDGEVQQFQCIDTATLMEWLVQGQFTPEAALVLADYLDL
ncbi:MAG: NUDIX domain-containing protein [Comamonadaceae bacterium]|nr:NUDIX domain-containing protein [Comamonadaceae bacterium]